MVMSGRSPPIDHFKQSKLEAHHGTKKFPFVPTFKTQCICLLHLSGVMNKPAFCICEYKGVGQLRAVFDQRI